jgi:hypothetical protein
MCPEKSFNKNRPDLESVGWIERSETHQFHVNLARRAKHGIHSYTARGNEKISF